MPPLRKISVEEAHTIATEARIVPAVVRDTTTLRFSKLPIDPRLEEVTWETFTEIARQRGIAVFESGGWLKLMRDYEAE